MCKSPRWSSGTLDLLYDAQGNVHLTYRISLSFSVKNLLEVIEHYRPTYKGTADETN